LLARNDISKLSGFSKSKQTSFGLERELAKGWALSLLGARQRSSTSDRMLMPFDVKERYDAMTTTLTKRFSSKGGVRMSHTIAHAEAVAPGWDGVTFRIQN